MQDPRAFLSPPPSQTPGMRPLVLFLLSLAVVAAACGGSGGNGGYALPGVDVNGGDGAIAKDSVAADSAGADSAGADSPGADSAKADAPTTSADAQDSGTAEDSSTVPVNSAPKFDSLAVLTLDQGTSTSLDIAPFLHDQEDTAAKLKLSWSAKHVALKDPGDHKLYVVAPTTWTGTEPIAMTVTDTGGATATATLTVVVKPVTVPTPIAPECGKHTFSFKVGAGNHTVLLSGSFNGWAKTADKADTMTDPGGTGTYSVVKVLAAGVYQYKFVVDDKWQPDTANPNQVPDGYGGTNAVIEVKPCAP